MAERKPNIVFILADDLGWGDLSCYGRPDYTTPHLDRMAADGARLTDCYSGSATCSPTRISLLTGRYPARHPAGLPEPILPRHHGAEIGLEPEFPALPRLLSKAGYRTALIGKWHCGEPPRFSPLKSGFDEYFGLSGTGAAYFSYRDEEGRYLARDGEDVAAQSGYLTHVLTDKACDFIARHSTEPFYLSMHYTAPHWPWEAAYQEDELHDRIATTGGGSLAIFADMVRALDDGVGRVLATLAAHKLDGRTLVVFTSDNGGERYSYHYPLTGHIRLLREGGIRVPGLVRWPGKIPPKQVSQQMAITMDWTATFLALAGATADPRFPSDGENLMPVLTGARSSWERRFFWRTVQADAVRSGPWKYLHALDKGREYLFNLVRDVREYSNFRDAEPGVFDELKAAFERWNDDMLPRPAPVKPLPMPHLEFDIY